MEKFHDFVYKMYQISFSKYGNIARSQFVKQKKKSWNADKWKWRESVLTTELKKRKRHSRRILFLLALTHTGQLLSFVSIFNFLHSIFALNLNVLMQERKIVRECKQEIINIINHCCALLYQWWRWWWWFPFCCILRFLFCNLVLPLFIISAKLFAIVVDVVLFNIYFSFVCFGFLLFLFF